MSQSLPIWTPQLRVCDLVATENNEAQETGLAATCQDLNEVTNVMTIQVIPDGCGQFNIRIDLFAGKVVYHHPDIHSNEVDPMCVVFHATTNSFGRCARTKVETPKCRMTGVLSRTGIARLYQRIIGAGNHWRISNTGSNELMASTAKPASSIILRSSPGQ
jgi:hypothetical protein